MPTLRLLCLSAVTGILAGLSAALFLYLLQLATYWRQTNPHWLWFLPLFGFAIGLAYHHLAGRAGRGTNLVLDEIHDPRELVPARMFPLVLGGTLLTHLGGGSAGREGTAVQMAAAAADQLGLVARLTREERRSLLMAGMGAGFGAALGAPIAGVIFGMEVVRAGRLRVVALAECAVASFTAMGIAVLVHAPHTIYPFVGAPTFAWYLPLIAALSGALFGLAARAFVLLEHGVELLFFRAFRYPPLRPFAGGLLLWALFHWEGSGRYQGLGLDAIQAALRTPAEWRDPLYKICFTALTLGTGFKGGEFIPFAFIGATLGSALAAFLGMPLPWLAALGFAAVFGAGANAPIACAVMAAELFGWGIFPYALLACYCGFLTSGHPGIYRTQPLHGKKLAGLYWWRGRAKPDSDAAN